MKTSRTQSGISLIEILVVMVLLLIGILSVIRLFPGGFLVNQRTEAATLAARLAEQEMNRYANATDNLMDAIVPIRVVAQAAPPGFGFQVDLDRTPDDLGQVPAQAGINLDPAYLSDANIIRRVLGETVRIPIPSPTIAGRGSLYILSAGPVFNANWVDENGLSLAASIFVSGAPLAHRTWDVNNVNPPPLFGPQQYAIDYDNHQVWFFPFNKDRQFLATYNFYDANNQVQSVVDEAVTVPANQSGPFGLAANRPLVWDSDRVGRRFLPEPVAFDWTTDPDPYEFKLLSQNEGNYANVGVLLFNPAGNTYTEYGAAGPQPLTARIDYDVLDWHIIREDRPMPATAPFQVHLTLKQIKRLGDIENDQSVYAGILRDPGIPTANRTDMMIYDLGTGTRVPANQFTVNYKEGTVTFTDAFGNANPSGTFRYFYRAHGEWALAIQKANASYRRRADFNVGMGEFYTPVAVNNDPGDAFRMYLPLMDAGKTISIREYYYIGNDGNTRRVTNEAYRVNANRSAFVSGLGTRILTFIDLHDKHPKFLQDGVTLNPEGAVSWTSVPTGQTATGVQGVSFRSRVIWSNGSNVSQAQGGTNDISTRWRKVDLDSFLTRTSGF